MKKIILLILITGLFSNCNNSKEAAIIKNSVEPKNDSINKLITNLVGNWSLEEKKKMELNNKAFFYRLRIDSMPKSLKEKYPYSIDISAAFAGVSDSIKKQIFPFESTLPIKIVEMNNDFGFLIYQNIEKTIKIKTLTKNKLILENGLTYIKE